MWCMVPVPSDISTALCDACTNSTQMVVCAVRNDVISGAERHREATVTAVRDIAIVQLRTRYDRTKRSTCTHNSREG